MKTRVEAIHFLKNLESGELRSAYQDQKTGEWKANEEVKKGILHVFRLSIKEKMDNYIDKDLIPPREFDNIDEAPRIVPRGSAIRRGAFVHSSVIMMPPSYINIGAYVDKGTMVDSHVLVGSCAQIGQNVHLSAGVQIGGVLEPIGMTPVIVEDNCFIGANCAIVEGAHLEKNVVLAPGVTISKSVPIYDLTADRILAPGESIPAGSVVVSGTRPLSAGKYSNWSKEQNLQMQCALIVKKRDAKSDASLELESILR